MNTRIIFSTIALASMTLILGCPAKPDTDNAAPAQSSVATPGNAAPAPTGESNAQAEPDTTTEDPAPVIRSEEAPPVEVVLPAGSAIDVDKQVRGQLIEKGRRDWVTPFAYGEGFTEIAAEVDRQLHEQGMLRVGGSGNNVVPDYTPGQGMKPSRASGKKTYISEDGRVLVFLTYEFLRGDDGQSDSEQYVLQIIQRDEPHPVNPPSFTEPIM